MRNDRFPEWLTTQNRSLPVRNHSGNLSLRINNATLRAENEGLRQLLSEREKVVALLESSSKHEPFWMRFIKQSKNEN